jgi:hypothetical protein
MATDLSRLPLKRGDWRQMLRRDRISSNENFKHTFSEKIFPSQPHITNSTLTAVF